MRILRVEDHWGYGYKGDRDRDSKKESLDSWSSFSMSHCSYSSIYNHAARPLPWKDGIPKSFIKRQGWYFGFTSEHQLVRWFSPHDLFLMSFFGGKVVEYEVDERNVWKGNNQCVFYKDSAVMVDSKSTMAYTYIKEQGDFIDQQEFNECLKEYFALIDKEHTTKDKPIIMAPSSVAKKSTAEILNNTIETIMTHRKTLFGEYGK